MNEMFHPAADDDQEDSEESAANKASQSQAPNPNPLEMLKAQMQMPGAESKDAQSRANFNLPPIKTKTFNE